MCKRCLDTAAAADRIVAQPGTLTGSIGVADIKPNLTPALKQVGINVEAVSVGKHARMESYFTGVTKQEHRWAESTMDRSNDCYSTVCIVHQSHDCLACVQCAQLVSY